MQGVNKQCLKNIFVSAAEEAVACPSLNENYQRGPSNSDSGMKEKTLAAAAESDGMVGHKVINDDADKI